MPGRMCYVMLLAQWLTGSADQTASTAASVIIVPGVTGGALDQQTCCHFEELMKNWCDAPHVWIFDHEVQVHTQQCWNAFCNCGEDLLSEMLKLVAQQPEVLPKPTCVCTC
jgi:hypothetical protein